MTHQLIHPLPGSGDIEVPYRFTYPYRYEAHPLCRIAANEVQKEVERHQDWKEEIACGKMMGVIVVADAQEPLRPIGFLAAFSGTLCRKGTMPYFVPPVFDLHTPGCYFQQEEAEISAINVRLRSMQGETEGDKFPELTLEVYKAKKQMANAKRQRDILRATLCANELADREEQMRKESQYLKAEVKRAERRLLSAREEEQRRIAPIQAKIEALKQERAQRSAALQTWLFHQFRFRNALGEERDLLDIFGTQMPPAGAGECCAPKLLQAAYTMGLKPLCMAEFWMGRSPVDVLRRQGCFYPACQAKCHPILSHMLVGLDVEPNPMAAQNRLMTAQMQVIYETSDLVVINKPAGMLSVPGKEDCPSVQSIMRERYPNATGPMMVHRLDMDTSGLMVVALNEGSYHALQALFLRHRVNKLYVALLEREMPVGMEGRIDLPLCANPDDRPRQMVSEQYGRRSITRYRVVANHNGHALVHLWPETGRTHQLRVHCAHVRGLNNPILGDALYGTPADRLYLHAQELSIPDMQLKIAIAPERRTAGDAPAERNSAT